MLRAMRMRCVILTILLLGSVAGADNMPANWKSVDKLVGEQKLEAAAGLVDKILEKARKDGDDKEWTRALIRSVQLRTGLHGYETAVRYLIEQPWPKGESSRVALELFKAHALVTYVQQYSWEIRQREKVEARGPLDLKVWTADQIVGEAQRAYQAIWKERARLGKEPVAALSEYVTPNDYPKEVRGTLRDAVAYLAVEMLSDSSLWSPEQSNDLFKLDVKKLLEPKQPDVKLDDPALHPMQKVAAVLADLEAWHAAEGKQEGALEARLERVRRLYAAFTDKGDRARIRADLEARLPSARKVPWWSMGMAQLAELERDTGDLVRAHATAEEGRKAYPDSIGGKKCLSFAKQIEAPDYQIQAMATDAANKRSIEVSHRNLGALYFRAYPVDLRKRLETAADYNLLPGYDEQKKLLGGKPAKEWTVQLPATPDYQRHRTFVTPQVGGNGLWVILASARKDFAEKSNRVVGMNFIVSDLVIVSRVDQSGGVDATIVAGESGKPLAGAEVTLWKFDWQRHHTGVETKKTDKDGGVAFSGQGREGAPYFLVAKNGNDLNVEASRYYLHKETTPGEQHSALVYTDRSVYRPLQKILWKVVAYRGSSEKASFKASPGETLTVSLRDANHQEVAKREVKTNDYGSASGEFAVPTGRVLGGWSVVTSTGGGAGVRVEEYKRPTFEVTLKDPEGALRLNKPATMLGEAKYYFGLPVVNGTVKWRVTRVPVFPWWWWWYGAPAQPQTIATGTAKLDEKGLFRFGFTAEADERSKESKDLTYRYEVSADLTDEGGETRSAERAFRLGFVAVEARVGSDVGFVREGQATQLTVARTNLDGVPRAGKGSWKLVTVQQPAKTPLPADLPVKLPVMAENGEEAPSKMRTPGDALAPRWVSGYQPDAVMNDWADGAELAHGEVTHDDKGVAKVTLPSSLKPGLYRLRYETTDEFGAKATTWKNVVVAGAKSTPVALPALLLAESTSVNAGGTARFVVRSGLPDETMFFDVYKAGRRVSRQRLEAAQTSVVELPVKDSDRGGFAVTLTVVRDHQHLRFAESVFVPWDDKELKVSFSTFRDKMRPGGKETWRVVVEGRNVEQGTAELLAYMYDRSLDLFAPHSPPSVLGLYPNRAQPGWVRVNLAAVGAQHLFEQGFADVPPAPELRGDQLKFDEDGYAIGGMGRRRFGSGVMGGMAPRTMQLESAAAPGAPPPPPAAQPSAPGVHRKMARAEEANDMDAEKKAAAPATGQASTTDTLRSNFAETAFWQPHLITDGKGGAAIEFTVPDSVTSWNVWVHAVTRDLRGGSVHKETRSVKELMVRPYLPRFFREGDRADLKVVVNNASTKPLSGTLTFDIVDPTTDKSVLAAWGLKDTSKPFTVQPGGGTNLTFAVTAPKQVGTVAFKVTARAGDLGDGELRPLPVLPGRFHLAQSRFVTLRDAEKRTMTFDDLKKGDDPTRVNEDVIVTLDAQLFFTVLKALPYLVTYPYECTEQTLNRFVSTGIVSSVFKDFPAVAKMAAEFAKQRTTQFETWDATDPNRKMTLEESPWLEVAKGGSEKDLVKLLDPAVARAERDAALAKLKKAQTSNGAFPWFPGGPPSPYMTLYIMHGFARLSEFGVEVPKDMVQRGWQYLAQHFREEWQKKDRNYEFITFLNYVASAYPDEAALTKDDRKQMLEYSFAHWKKHSPYMKAYLALTLKRMGRAKDGKLVFDSVMDSAKTVKDQGTFWAPEDRGWLWYNDTTESHAFALRTLTELDPQNPKKDGLVLWLMLDKKLNHWKSTRATAEVIYSLVHYMKADKSLGVREAATVDAGPVKQTFTFEPDHYVGKSQLVVPPAQVPQASTVTVEKQTKGVMFASATWHFSTEKLPAEARGDFFEVTRKYFKREMRGKEWVLKPLAEGATIAPGDEVEVQLSLKSKHAAEYVHLRDPRAAGLEPENVQSRYRWDLGIVWYEEVRDSGTNFFFEWLPAGQYTFKYRLRANLGGTFKVSPATVQSMYAPEFNAYSAGDTMSVAPK